MSDRLAKMHKQSSLFHPSQFEKPHDIPLDEKTLLAVHEQRTRPIKTLENLKSPGQYKFVEKEDILPDSDTTFLYKNLYSESLLTQLFFSPKNIQNVQSMLRFLVYKNTNQVIDKQSTSELLVIMRSIFFEHSAHPEIMKKEMTEREKQLLFVKYTNEVNRLNNLIFNEVVPKVVSQLQQYMDYLRDVSQQPQQMERPKTESVKGQRQYRSITQVLTGNSL